MQAPAILRNRGVKAPLQFREQYDDAPEAHKRWSFDSSIYGATSVKKALQKAQHDKCAFCESKISHISYGDVEHFRPKAAYRQGPDDPLIRPGYYWLAYEWSNLLFCCQLCNQRFKGNLFPLMDVTQRAKTHHHDIKNEQPLFIHPAIEDPSDFLEFQEQYLCAINGNKRGEATIGALCLNREKLAEMRNDHLELVKALIDCRAEYANDVAIAPTLISVERLSKVDALLVQCSRDSAQYAAMVRAALPKPH
jgi:uncharacterized protein (TIGR02646 family)